MQPDGFKNLGAAIALDGGYAHFGSHLDHALDGGFDIILAGVLVLDFHQQPARIMSSSVSKAT